VTGDSLIARNMERSSCGLGRYFVLEYTWTDWGNPQHNFSQNTQFLADTWTGHYRTTNL